MFSITTAFVKNDTPEEVQQNAVTKQKFNYYKKTYC